MPELHQRLNAVRQLPVALREAALVATLPHAAEGGRDHLIAELLALPGLAGRPGALLPAARFWATLSPHARAAIRAALGPGFGALSRALRDAPDPHDRRAAALIAIDAWAQPHADVDAPLSDLDEPLAHAASTFPEHRLGAVLDVVVRLAHAPGPHLRAFLDDPSQPAHLALRAAARGLAAPLRARRAVSWLSLAALEPLARDVLTRGLDDSARAGALEESHLLRARGRRAGAQRLGNPLELVAPGDMSVRARRGRMRWIGAVALPEAQRVALLHEAMSDPDAPTRLGAVCTLASLEPSPAMDDALRDFAFDPCGAVAAAAAGTLASARSPTRRRRSAALFERLTRSPHPAVRALARQQRAIGERALDRAGPWDGAVGARAWASMDRAGFVAACSARIAAGGAPALAALELARRLGVAHELVEDVLAAAMGADEHLAAKAALVLASVPGPLADEVLDAALAHASGRVRASAVEALSVRTPDDARLTRGLSDDVARVRANCLRHALRAGETPTGKHALAEMLNDERAGHRVSALWVAQRLRRTEVSQRVADLTRRDPDPAVRARARRCAGVLLGTLRAGWSERLGAPGSDEGPLAPSIEWAPGAGAGALL